MATTATPTPHATIEQVLDLARAYVSATDSRRYSHATRALSQLADLVRALPSWLLPPVVEPAAEVERMVGECRYRVGNEDGHLVVAVSDGDDATVLVLTEQQAVQMRADLARVLAAMGGGR
jgi:hypothetical protein